jgi:dTDP-glucose pyrophosphorylase
MSCLVVLAAGIGSRYGGLKQMDPVGPSGEFIVDYSIFDARRAGFGRVVFVIRRDIEEAFRATIGARVARHIAVDYAFQEVGDLPTGHAVPPGRVKPWGTGHAVLAAAARVAEPFAVINADDFYGRESYAVLHRFLTATASDPTAFAMVGFTLRGTLSEHGTVARGICRTRADGRLERIEETLNIERRGAAVACPSRALDGGETVSMNMWGFKPSVFPRLRDGFERFLVAAGGDLKAEYYLPTAIQGLMDAGRATVTVLTTSSAWMGVTNREDRTTVVAQITEKIRRGEYPPALWV